MNLLIHLTSDNRHSFVQGSLPSDLQKVSVVGGTDGKCSVQMKMEMQSEAKQISIARCMCARVSRDKTKQSKAKRKSFPPDSCPVPPSIPSSSLLQ